MTSTQKEVPVSSDEAKPAQESKSWEGLSSLRSEIDHLFEEVQESWPFGKKRRMQKFMTYDSPFTLSVRMPAVDVVDRGNEVVLKAELPGMDEKDIDVQLSDRMITISGEKKMEREEGKEDDNYYLSERHYGSFKRSLSLPDGIDSDKVEAAFHKGVLTVTLPKTPDAVEKTKKIEVKGTH